MSANPGRGHTEIAAAIAAITGQSVIDVESAFQETRREEPVDRPPTAETTQSLIDRIKTRLGLAPAVGTDQAADLTAPLVDSPGCTPQDDKLLAWTRICRSEDQRRLRIPLPARR